MIKLKHLELVNFLSHVDTSVSLENYGGLVLIEGKTSDGHYSSNGSGKSTLLEGIVYAISGNTLRGVGVNDVVNRNYKKNTRVTLRFTKGDIDYQIDRYRKHEEYGDSIVFTREGENISKRVNKETQALIEDTIGISYKVLVSTILLGEGLSSRFTQLSDPDKKSLIESTLNLNYDMNALRAKANSELSQLKLTKSNLEGKISALEGYIDYDVDKAKEEITSLELSVANEMKLIEKKNTAIGEYNSEITQLVEKMQLLKSSIDKIDYLTREINNLDSENSRLVAELTNSEKCDNPRCTVCHQELSNEESREAFRASYKEKIDNLTNRIIETRSQLDSLPPRDILSNKYEEISMRVVTLRNEVANLTSDSRQLQSSVYRMKDEMANLKAIINNYSEANNNISNLKTELSDVESRYDVYDYFYKLFSPTGVIVSILSEAVSYINERISTYSEVLLDKRYELEFKKGKISLVDTSGASYQSLSNGEKRRLDISIQFALHDYVSMYCGMEMDCCCIDEILDTLDDIGVENIIDVLRIKLQYCSLNSIFVITHNDALKSKFDQIITVCKDEKGDSRVV